LPSLEAIKALNQAGVRYVVVGGLATIAHGFIRFTSDADVVVALDTENARKAFEAILSVGFVPAVPVRAEEFADAATREGWIAEKNMMVLNFRLPSDPMQSVDVFVKYPLEFEKMYTDSVVSESLEVPTRVCSIDDLIRIKLEAGRPKDLEDVRNLEIIREDRA